MTSRLLTLPEVCGADAKIGDIVEELDGGDRVMLLGHADVATAQERIEQQDWYEDPRLLVDRVDQVYVQFDQHGEFCDQKEPVPLGHWCPSQLCHDPAWAPWHWREVDDADTQDAYPVTIAFLELLDIDTPETTAAAATFSAAA